jgi:hypothetical protein
MCPHKADGVPQTDDGHAMHTSAEASHALIRGKHRRRSPVRRRILEPQCTKKAHQGCYMQTRGARVSTGAGLDKLPV